MLWAGLGPTGCGGTTGCCGWLFGVWGLISNRSVNNRQVSSIRLTLSCAECGESRKHHYDYSGKRQLLDNLCEKPRPGQHRQPKLPGRSWIWNRVCWRPSHPHQPVYYRTVQQSYPIFRIRSYPSGILVYSLLAGNTPEVSNKCASPV